MDSSDPDYQLKTYTETLISPYGNQETTFDVSYDNEGRITSLISQTGPKMLFTFSANEYTMDIYDGNQPEIHETFFLIDGLVDSTIQNNADGNFTSEKYYYNANKQLVKLLLYDLDIPILESTTTFTYDAKGNMATSAESDGAITTYAYYEDKLNNVPDINPTPLHNTNLLKKKTADFGGGLIVIVDVTYTFDNKQRISTMTQTGDGITGIKKFTYRN